MGGYTRLWLRICEKTILIIYEYYDNFCFPVTIHPDVSGHPYALKMLERYVASKLCI